MARSDVYSYDQNADLNTDVQGVSTAEGWAPSSVNNVIRAWLAQWAAFIASPLLKKLQNVSTILDTAATPVERMIGYRGVPPLRSLTASGTAALTDAGGRVDIDATGLTFTVPTNATVAFPLDTVIVLNNNVNGTATIAPSSGVTLRLAGAGAIGSRALAAYGIASLVKTKTDEWKLCGAGAS